MKIRKYTLTENLVSAVFAIGVSTVMLVIMALNEEPKKPIMPRVEPIEEIEVIEQSISTAPSGIMINEEPEQEKHSQVLTASRGVAYGPSGKETYYNLPMKGVVSIMRKAGYTEEDYPYYVREDGVKCLGDYIMVAANLDKHPRGSVVETTLGTGIVCDTGEAMIENPDMVDIAVDW